MLTPPKTTFPDSRTGVMTSEHIHQQLIREATMIFQHITLLKRLVRRGA